MRLWIAIAALFGCGPKNVEEPSAPGVGGTEDGASDPEDQWVGARKDMVAGQIERRGISDTRVLQAMGEVPRHRFMPKSRRIYAYDDRPQPIGKNQTISQPYIVALMSELARLEPGEKVLEVGTGSGYQAAVLAAMGVRVWTIEIVPELAEQAAEDLQATGYNDRVHGRTGDGYQGWPEAAPFDAVLVTAAPDHVPLPLKEQLKVGGRLVIPVGNTEQDLVVITRTEEGWEEEKVVPVLFVPMTGEAQAR